MAGSKEVPLRILSLDGGGVRGLTSLLLLQSIFQSIETLTGRKVHPYEYFDLIAGTSTGGLIAIMLGRLRMSIEEAIEAYKKLSQNIFKKKWWSDYSVLKILGAEMNRTWFQGQNLQDAVCTLLSEKQLDPDASLREAEEPRCKVFVCAVDAHSSMIQLLRSYWSRAPGQFNYDCSIWEAARATSAAPLFFEPVTLRKSGFTFVDGAVRANNPVEEAVNEARSLWPDREIGCLLSLGTGISLRRGFHPKKNSLHAVLGSLAKISTDANAKHIAFKRSPYCSQLLQRRGYFRFSVSQGISDIDMSEFEKLPMVQSATIQYTIEVSKEIEECAKQLASWDESYLSAMALRPDISDDTAQKFLTLLEIDWEKPVGAYAADFQVGVLIILVITRILSAYNQIANMHTEDPRPARAQLTTLQLVFQTQCFLLLSPTIHDNPTDLHQFVYSRGTDPASLLRLLRCSNDETLALENAVGERMWSVLLGYEQQIIPLSLPQYNRINRQHLAQLQALNLEIHALARSRGHLRGFGPNLPDTGHTVDTELSKLIRINEVSRHLQDACQNLWSCAEHPTHSVSLKLSPPIRELFSSPEDQKASVSFDLVLTNVALDACKEPASFKITCSMRATTALGADGELNFLDRDGYIYDPLPLDDVNEQERSRGRMVTFEDEILKPQEQGCQPSIVDTILKPLCTFEATASSASNTPLGFLPGSDATILSVQLLKPERIFGVTMPGISWLRPNNGPSRRLGRVNNAEKMRFACQLAEIVLAHHSTPWLEHSFSKAHVSFWSSTTKFQLTSPFLFHQQGTTKKATAGVSEPHTDPWVKNPILFGLGIMLLELEYEMPIESLIPLLSKGERSPGPDKSLSERLLTVKYSAGSEMGTSYGRIVRMCLDCDFGLGLREYSLRDTMLQRRYYVQVIAEFKQLLLQWEKIYSL